MFARSGGYTSHEIGGNESSNDDGMLKGRLKLMGGEVSGSAVVKVYGD